MKKFPFVLSLAASLSLTQSLPAFAQFEEEEPEGVPHIVVAANAGAIDLEFEGITPVPGVAGPNGEELITLFLPQAQGQLGIAPSPLSGNVFGSNPVSGITSGFINDDTGFESEGLPNTADIDFRLVSADLATDVDFVIGFGNFRFSSVELELAGSGLSQLAIGDVVSLPGQFEFDAHPEFQLVSSLADLSAVEGTFVFDLIDNGASNLDTATFAIRLTANTAEAVLVPEPATAGLLALGGVALATRRRRA